MLFFCLFKDIRSFFSPDKKSATKLKSKEEKAPELTKLKNGKDKFKDSAKIMCIENVEESANKNIKPSTEGHRKHKKANSKSDSKRKDDSEEVTVIADSDEEPLPKKASKHSKSSREHAKAGEGKKEMGISKKTPRKAKESKVDNSKGKKRKLEVRTKQLQSSS